jgi:23S rRNA (cytidine1920-2'-O)/16S rRNA (cytidine1409-2'-O)-methyltransferase
MMGPYIMARERLDKALVARGLAPSRERAHALLLAGVVLVDGQPQAKAGTLIHPEATIRLTHDPQPYVSRGGLKLEQALDFFHIDPTGKVVMDVGASTGGFTDCLLQRGARRVYAVDVGYGQLAWQLQQDPRVVNLQRRNIRYLKWEEVGEKVDLAVVDTSFISLELVIPPLLTFLKQGGGLLTLVKPQFEVGKGEVGKGGVVRNPEKHRQVVERILKFAEGQGLIAHGCRESPLQGPKGNKEFFLYSERPHGQDRGTEAG